MSSSIDIPIKFFPRNWFVTWDVSSQCYNNGKIQIISGENVLQTIKKTDPCSRIQFLGNGYAHIPSEEMKIVVSINEGFGPIYERHQANMILNSNGETIGIMAGMYVEIPCDEEINGFLISLTGWAKEG